MMSKLVPKLRFREFSGDWEEKLLGNIYKFFPTNSFPRDKLNYEIGTVKNIHYGDIHTKFSILFDITKEIVPYINESVNIERIKETSYCVEGDIIFADASEDLDDIGKSMEITNLNSEKLLSGLHTLHARQKNKNITKGFGGYLFKSSFMRNQIKRESQGTKVLGISVKRLEKISITFPRLKEQQKIAKTLTSLDNLIEAKNKKVESLKKYKKGLMQKLFPLDGEKKPKLRFDGFGGDWDIVNLIEICKFKQGIQIPVEEQSAKKTNERVRFLRISDYTQSTSDIRYVSKNYSNYIISKDDIVMVRYGETAGFIGRNLSGVLANNLFSINPNEKINKTYLYTYLSDEKIYNYLKGLRTVGAIPAVSFKSLNVINIPLPSIAEQQKIANTLSSLDNLIEAQTKKVETLKQHKKGLMQKLFVNKEEN